MKSKKILRVTLPALAALLTACAAGTDAPKPNPALATTSVQAEMPNSDTKPVTIEPDKPVVEESQIIDLKIHAASLENNMLGENTEQGIAVYLPVGYELSDKKYPVLYYLPGYGDSYFTFLTIFKGILDEDDIDSMIVVSVNGNNKFDGSFYTNSPVTGNWEDFVTKDVIAYVDANYRTIPESSGRGIAGHSMGGYGVISIVMNNPNLFDYAYSMSPGLFDEEGLSESPLNFKVVEKRIEQYAEMTGEEAAADWLERSGKQSWPNNFSFSYGCTFAPDVDGKAPYIMLPDKDENDKFIQDDVWKMYDAGYGGLRERVEASGENLKELKKLVIEYGIFDGFKWIPKGCEYFSELLTESGIAHELIPFEGGHEDIINIRLRTCVVPFFAETFGEVAG